LDDLGAVAKSGALGGSGQDFSAYCWPSGLAEAAWESALPREAPTIGGGASTPYLAAPA